MNGEFVRSGLGLLLGVSVVGAAALPARGAITSVSASAASVAKYAKLELSVKVDQSYKNPYDPEEADLSAEFASPSNKVWKVNGFYDGTGWKVRFAANETGAWHYVVSVKDAAGTSRSQSQAFTCTDSTFHGWVKVAENKRYLSYDDGTSFFGVGACYAWGENAGILDQMKASGFNTFVYWNGTYDANGGNNLIESMTSGLGKYDQRKCARLDTLIDWSEARDMAMILVILPHDYACQNVGGTWPAKWSLNPYSTIVSSDAYYSDATSWSYQQKQYRYIIAGWGYSRGLGGWQTVDEISGTNGWVADQATANAWTAKVADYFHSNDPFKHPTTASLGGFWDQGNKVNDLPNTEVYGNYATGNIVATVQRLWNTYEKPCIMGETGAEGDGEASHRKIWGGLAAGISVTPLLWQVGQGWNTSITAQYPAFNAFIADIHFAGLKHPAQAKLSIPGMVEMPAATAAGAGRGRGRGPAAPDFGVWGITSDELTFGWVTGPMAGHDLHATGLADGTYRIEWWDTTTGKVIATAQASAVGGALSAPVAGTTQNDLAFKIIGPVGGGK